MLLKRSKLKKNFDAEHRELGKHLDKLFDGGKISIQQNREIHELCFNFLSRPAEQVEGHKAMAMGAVRMHKDVKTNLSLVNLAAMALDIIENESAIKKNDEDIADIDGSLSRLKRVS